MLQHNDIDESKKEFKIFDFMYWNKLAFLILGLLIISSILIIFIFNFNWGIDFTGGTLVEINLEKSINIDLLRNKLMESGFKKPIVQKLNNSKNIMIKVSSFPSSIDTNKLSTKLVSIVNKYERQKVIINRIDFIGPSVGTELIKNGLIALLFAIIAIFAYISYRFEWCLASGTVIALLSDLIITFGFLSLFYIEIDLTIVASLMSIIGYSLNDKIVISDRIRENINKMQSISYYKIINISLNQVLNRTLMTSFVTLIMVLILLIFGGSLLKDFSLTMLIGIIIGTISSIYISLPISLIVNKKCS
ncbi:protein translocase subunit SecF [Candidatus Pantoea edessiphila]|uniref:Protein-export membrane protein SecF n=1 Tax=Candidatus Pantoea edessiphila TaxID=2044610 RepID=A0A2P5T1B3_9GAMM|nr:protein translocase subunit SecF [Candidatus Pantoea edessiphila]PPI88389.1 protein translocase subunit SecF [Candidatus Pantoea edessiphila]